MRLTEAEKRFVEAAVIINGLCLGLFVARIIFTGVSRYWFVPQNILLAWLALIFAWLLVRHLSKIRWLSWSSLALTLLWLAFLPNTWYVMTDFIHVHATGEISQLYDISLMVLLTVSGFMAGFTSLLLVHKQLRRRLSSLATVGLLGLIILAASFAIFLGRDMRWNSWDLLVNPGGLALNVSDRLSDPLGQPRMLTVTSIFFVVISGGYAAIWRLVGPRN